MKCDGCNTEVSKEESYTVNPQSYLGGAFPDRATFCPGCWYLFSQKTDKILKEDNETKMISLRKIINS